VHNAGELNVCEWISPKLKLSHFPTFWIEFDAADPAIGNIKGQESADHKNHRHSREQDLGTVLESGFGLGFSVQNSCSTNY
jgi:hypothetical protein